MHFPLLGRARDFHPLEMRHARHTSKMDLHWWWPTHIHKYYLVEVGRTIDWETGYFHHIRLLKLEEEFFKTATQYTLNTPCKRCSMPNFRETALLETLAKHQELSVDEDLLFCVETWVRTETDILTEWFRLGTTPHPEIAAKRLTSVIPQALYQALDI